MNIKQRSSNVAATGIDCPYWYLYTWLIACIVATPFVNPHTSSSKPRALKPNCWSCLDP
ncbi:hypothetical protein M440DRAFT_141622 [Trichoderma longibrachiatum ATCC 18648]|uniref:Uncharacterized protein n=1 Tax=Trichoderma longibrachiatum ATCC 18648 TaxID=983965 RepID=A0A2T4BUU5_TRILO|nr:hypothetical protein M440DRAFT_141622 [Trichoderma longibrachiatum ATCC 18648]